MKEGYNHRTKNQKILSSVGIILLRMELYSMVIKLIREIEKRTKLSTHVCRYFHSVVELVIQDMDVFSGHYYFVSLADTYQLDQGLTHLTI